MRTFQPSMVIEDSYECPIAAVEVTSSSDIIIDDTSKMWESTLEHSLPAHVPYFLLVSQNTGFLWKGSPSLNTNSSPDYEFPMHNVIVRFSRRQPEQRLHAEELGYVVLRWLMNLSSKPQDMEQEPEKTLERAGFVDAIKGAEG